MHAWGDIKRNVTSKHADAVYFHPKAECVSYFLSRHLISLINSFRLISQFIIVVSCSIVNMRKIIEQRKTES